MRELTPFAYLNVKFVCRRLYIAGKNVDGGDLVLHKYAAPGHVKIQHPYTYSTFRGIVDAHVSAQHTKKAAFGAVMARIEASLSTKIVRTRLTCYECGKIAGIALKDGFCDESFQQADGFRCCLECQSDTPDDLTLFHIRRKAFHCCRGCESFKPESLAVREQNVKEAHYAGTDRQLVLVLKEFRRVSKGEKKLCAACYGKVVGGHEDEESKKKKKKKTSFGTFRKR